MRRPTAFRNPVLVALALCLALVGIVQAGWSAGALDSSRNDWSPSSKLWQPPRDHAATAPATHFPHARAANLHRAPLTGLKFAGAPAAAAPQISALLANRHLPFPRSCAVAPRSGRSPPLPTCR